MSEEALQISVKRREVKRKGEKERHTRLNVEIQLTARKGKKACLSDQCKEIEENNRTGKTSDLLKKIRYTERTFHAKMGTLKDRNGGQKQIIRRGGRNAQKKYTKKILMT